MSSAESADTDGKAGPNTIVLSCEALVVINTQYSEGGAEHILLSNEGRNLCASVCLSAFLLNRELFIQSTLCVEGELLRTQWSAVSHFGAIWTCSK